MIRNNPGSKEVLNALQVATNATAKVANDFFNLKGAKRLPSVVPIDTNLCYGHPDVYALTTAVVPKSGAIISYNHIHAADDIDFYLNEVVPAMVARLVVQRLHKVVNDAFGQEWHDVMRQLGIRVPKFKTRQAAVHASKSANAFSKAHAAKGGSLI